MITYPMDIRLFSLQTATIVLLLLYYKGYGIQDKLSWGDSYGTAVLLQVIKGEEAQPPPLYDPVLVLIEAALNDDS